MKTLLATLLFVTTFAFGQIGTGTSTRIGGENSRWTFGGGVGFGLSGGSNGTGTTISISPRVGYLITDNLDAGVAGGFTWGNNRYFSSTAN